MHFFESASFLGPDGTEDILYSGTLVKVYLLVLGILSLINEIFKDIDPKNIDWSCRIRKCYTDSEVYKTDLKLQDLCRQIDMEKGVPREMDLYIANQYGHIKDKLTNDDTFYFGDPVVSPDFQSVVFSKETDDDYELFQMNLNGTGLKQVHSFNLIINTYILVNRLHGL